MHGRCGKGLESRRRGALLGRSRGGGTSRPMSLVHGSARRLLVAKPPSRAPGASRSLRAAPPTSMARFEHRYHSTVGKATLQDDAGREVVLYDIHAARDEGDAADPGLAELRDRLSRGFRPERPGDLGVDFLVAVALILLVLAIGWAISRAFGPTSGLGNLGKSLYYFAIPLISLWLRREQLRRVASRVASSLLSEGRCASCAYRLEGLVPAGQGPGSAVRRDATGAPSTRIEGRGDEARSVADGALVCCPECGANWLVSRVGAAVVMADEGERSTSQWRTMLHLGWPPRKQRWNTSPIVKDANERVFRLVNLRRAEVRDASLKDVRSRMLRRTLETRGLVSLLLLIGALICLLVGLSFVRHSPRGVLPAMFMIGVPLVLGGMACVMGWQAVRVFVGDTALVRRAVKDELLSEGRCPACASTVERRAERMGRLCCGACGAEW